MVGHFSCSSVRNSLNKNGLKSYILVQLLFGRDMIILIKDKVVWELIRQRKQAQLNKYNIFENKKELTMTITSYIK